MPFVNNKINIFDIILESDNSYAIIIFTKPVHAKMAINLYNGLLLDGNRLIISLYTTKISSHPSEQVIVKPKYC